MVIWNDDMISMLKEIVKELVMNEKENQGRLLDLRKDVSALGDRIDACEAEIERMKGEVGREKL